LYLRSMQKSFLAIFFLVIFGSCNYNNSGSQEPQDADWEVAIANLPKKNKVNAKAQNILKDWKAYGVFEASFDKLYKVEFREDLVLLVEELVENQKLLEASNYPAEFDIPQIKSRQKVLKTYILKIKGNLEYRQHPEQTLKEIIIAFNHLRTYFNIKVNSNLPDDLFSKE